MTAADRPSVTDNARDEEPLAWCPGCGDRIPTEVIRERGVCSNCHSTSDDPWAAGRPSADQALAEAWAEGHRTGWEHCQDGNYGNDHWDDPTPNPYAAAARAETTTEEWPRCKASRDGGCDRCHDEHGRHIHCRAETTTATAEDAARVMRDEWMQRGPEVTWLHMARTLDAHGLLATARTRPTRDELDRVISDGLREHGAFRTDLIADAVLALFRGGDK